MAKVLVTGGTGFVGREIVAQLHALGYRIRLLARDGGAARAFAAKYSAEIAVGDIGDEASVAAACQGVDAVIHLVGILYEKGGRTFEKIHVEGTRHVVRAAERAGVKRYIHMSALGKRHRSGAHHAEYHRTKALAEAIVRKSPLDWTIFRPSLIFGPGDGFVNGLAALMRFPVSVLQLHAFPLIGGGKTLLQPVSISDVGTAFTKSIAHPEAVGQTYDLVGPERFTLREVIQEIAAALGKKTVVEGVPPWRLLGRAALWALVGLIPLYVLAMFTLPLWLPIAVMGAAPLLHPKAAIHAIDFAGGTVIHVSSGFVLIPLLWLAILVTALRWRTLILFHLPWPAAFAAGAVLGLLPKPPLTMGQVWMLKGDNIGDAAPAAAAFALPLRGFREGIRAYLYHP